MLTVLACRWHAMKDVCSAAEIDSYLTLVIVPPLARRLTADKADTSSIE